jgi:hypothetical protein
MAATQGHALVWAEPWIVSAHITLRDRAQVCPAAVGESLSALVLRGPSGRPAPGTRSRNRGAECGNAPPCRRCIPGDFRPASPRARAGRFPDEYSGNGSCPTTSHSCAYAAVGSAEVMAGSTSPAPSRVAPVRKSWGFFTDCKVTKPSGRRCRVHCLSVPPSSTHWASLAPGVAFPVQMPADRPLLRCCQARRHAKAAPVRGQYAGRDGARKTFVVHGLPCAG